MEDTFKIKDIIIPGAILVLFLAFLGLMLFTLDGKLNDANADINDLNTNNNQLAATLVTVIDQKNAVEQQVVQITQNRDLVQSQLNTANSNITNLNTQISTLNLEKSQLIIDGNNKNNLLIAKSLDYNVLKTKTDDMNILARQMYDNFSSCYLSVRGIVNNPSLMVQTGTNDYNLYMPLIIDCNSISNTDFNKYSAQFN